MKKIKIKHFFLLLLISMFFSWKSNAQNDDEQLKIIEKYIENSDLSVDYNELNEYLNYNKNEKINLNTATPFQLYSLGFLSYVQIKAIIKHRNEYGEFISVNELQTIDSLSAEIIQKLKLYVVINTAEPKLDLLKYLKESEKNLIFYTKISNPLSRGYNDSSIDKADKFLGSPFANRIKFNANYSNKFIFGFNAEKDAGEEFFSGANKKGYDFYSGYIFIKKNKKIKHIVIGDFKADFGQGLVLSGGLYSSKNALITNVKKTNTGIRPFNSFNENDFLRGSAITVNLKKLDITLLLSGKKNDAVLDTISLANSDYVYIKSTNESGYHRTSNEILNKNISTELLAAQNITYTNKNYRLGFTSLFRKNEFDKEPNKQLYEKHIFTSKEFYKVGIDWDYYFKNINIFGEAAAGSLKSTGAICGTNISLGNFADFSAVFRNYSKNFIQHYTNAFSENSNPMNERGFYSGIIIYPLRKIQISAFYDLYKMPWYSYYTDGSGKGNDIFFETKYEPDKASMIYVRVRKKSELKNSEAENYNNLDSEEKTSIRLHAEKALSTKFYSKFRIEFSKFKSAEGIINKGNLIYTDFTYKPSALPFSANTRLTMFNTDNYSTGIYALENDLLYAWSVPKFYNSGIKFYALLKVKYKKINIQYKYSILKYYNKTSIGSGNSEIVSSKIEENSLLINYTIN